MVQRVLQYMNEPKIWRTWLGFFDKNPKPHLF
jgi:hypothetical protein